MTKNADPVVVGFDRLKAGRPGEALLAFERALRSQPRNPEAHLGSGLALIKLGQLTRATQALESTLRFDQNNFSACIHLGDIYRISGRRDGAIGFYRRAIDIDPNSSVGLSRLGDLFFETNNFELAIEAYRNAISREPENPDLHGKLGQSLASLNLMSEALVSLSFSLSIMKNNAGTLHGMGLIAEADDRFSDAERFFRAAISAKLDYPEAHVALATLLLRQKKFSEGLEEYQWRWRLANQAAKRRPFRHRPWDRKSPIEEPILVWQEQGLGDEIFFGGWMVDLFSRGVRITCECDPRLTKLFQRSFGGMKVVPRSEPPATDCTDRSIKRQVSAGDLLYSLTECTWPPTPRQSYLKADPERTKSIGFQLEELLGPSYSRKIKVGIAWKSQRAGFGRAKSIDVSRLVQSMNSLNANIEYVSLQYGATAAEIASVRATTGVTIHEVPELDLKNDIDGLASIIVNCDLVVTVSNATAHLSGALGAPCWILLPKGYGLLWYWFNEGSSTPWYQSARLFRQKRAGDWSDPLNAVAQQIHGMLVV